MFALGRAQITQIFLQAIFHYSLSLLQAARLYYVTENKLQSRETSFSLVDYQCKNTQLQNPAEQKTWVSPRHQNLCPNPHTVTLPGNGFSPASPLPQTKTSQNTSQDMKDTFPAHVDATTKSRISNSTQKPKRKTQYPQKIWNMIWTWRDLNPRHLRCERSYLPLIYKPNCTIVLCKNPINPSETRKNSDISFSHSLKKYSHLYL